MEEKWVLLVNIILVNHVVEHHIFFNDEIDMHRTRALLDKALESAEKSDRAMTVVNIMDLNNQPMLMIKLIPGVTIGHTLQCISRPISKSWD
jgi:hypothetical protein